MAKGHSSRYSAYTGGPDPLAPPVDLREALEQIGQDVMAGTSPRRALSELLRRGTKSMPGADRLAAEANRRRRELLRRNNLDGTLQEIKKLLDEAVLAERKELARALDDDARFGELQLDALPSSPAKASSVKATLTSSSSAPARPLSRLEKLRLESKGRSKPPTP